MSADRHENKINKKTGGIKMFDVYYSDGEYFKTVYDENEADYTAWAIGGFYVIK